MIMYILLNFIDTKYKEGYDFFGSRTDYKWKDFISGYINKTDNTNIFNHKIFNYDLDSNLKPEWGDASLPAEYLLIFNNNNNNKLNLFYNSFKYFHDYLANKDYTEGTWAEGFELGVSALLAGFKPFDIGWHHPIWSKMFTPNGYKIGPNAIVHPTEQI